MWDVGDLPSVFILWMRGWFAIVGLVPMSLVLLRLGS